MGLRYRLVRHMKTHGTGWTEERSRLIDIDPPPSPERPTFTISAGFAASAAKTVPEPNDQASSIADLAME